MARRARSLQILSLVRRASALFVALAFALGVATHGFSEREADHQSPVADIALTVASVQAHSAPSDALCSHVHSEHHQMAPCVSLQENLHRVEARVAYPSFDAHETSHESAPPHGPPKA